MKTNRNGSQEFFENNYPNINPKSSNVSKSGEDGENARVNGYDTKKLDFATKNNIQLESMSTMDLMKKNFVSHLRK